MKWRGIGEVDNKAGKLEGRTGELKESWRRKI